ncbi:hypothetical protein QBC43DRAFT_373529 [Cladorrhinum sp. PSN259]|nr:hypothetical protein QBC43DRAFT_373529 [Cladorrhinum sp. PSN259]
MTLTAKARVCKGDLLLSQGHPFPDKRSRLSSDSPVQSPNKRYTLAVEELKDRVNHIQDVMITSPCAYNDEAQEDILNRVDATVERQLEDMECEILEVKRDVEELQEKNGGLQDEVEELREGLDKIERRTEDVENMLDETTNIRKEVAEVGEKLGKVEQQVVEMRQEIKQERDERRQEMERLREEIRNGQQMQQEMWKEMKGLLANLKSGVWGSGRGGNV